MGSDNQQDLSSFMSVLIMTIGALTIVLVANTLIIASNPDNLEITSIFTSDKSSEEGDVGQPMFENTSKEPTYIDVERDQIFIYPGPVRVLAGDLERDGNPFMNLLAKIDANKEREYIVMLLRPRSAVFARRIRSIIREREIDVGQELYETGKPINYKVTAPLEPEAEPSPEAEVTAEVDIAEEAEALP